MATIYFAMAGSGRDHLKVPSLASWLYWYLGCQCNFYLSGTAVYDSLLFIWSEVLAGSPVKDVSETTYLL